VNRLKQIRDTRDEAACQAALNALTESAALHESTSNGDHPQNLLKLAIDAARVRCTLGEISDALEAKWGRHVPKTQVVQGAYRQEFKQDSEAEKEFEETATLIEKFANDEGRRPRMLVAKMGQDGHDRGAKVVASGFADMGFDVDVGPMFSTPEEIADSAVDSDVHVVGVSSQAAGHKTLVPGLIRALKERGADHIIVIAGGVIPPQDYAFLYDAGVKAIFGPGTRITTAAADVVKAIQKAQAENIRVG